MAAGAEFRPSVNQIANSYTAIARGMERTEVLKPVGHKCGDIIAAQIRNATGVSRGSTIARRKWRGVYATPSRNARVLGREQMLIGVAPPGHLVVNPTVWHPIGARRLATRRKIKAHAGALLAGGAPGQRFVGRKGLRSTSKGAQALKFGGVYRAWANHPGTSGAPESWRRGVKAVETYAPKALLKSYTDIIEKEI